MVKNLFPEVGEHRHGVDEARVEVVGDLVRERDRQQREDVLLVVAAAWAKEVLSAKGAQESGTVLTALHVRI